MTKNQDEKQKFAGFLAGKNLKHSQPRDEVATVFFNLRRHVTVEELYRKAKGKNPKLGYATVYRTLKLLTESGLGRELKFEDGTSRYEPMEGKEHHDHLICIKCGCCIEVFDAEIERLQDRIFCQHEFNPQRHRLELYGICKQCQR